MSFVRIIGGDGEVPFSMCNYCSSVLTYFQSLIMYTSGRAMYCFVLMFILVLPTYYKVYHISDIMLHIYSFEETAKVYVGVNHSREHPTLGPSTEEDQVIPGTLGLSTSALYLK